MKNCEQSCNEYKRRTCLAMNYIADHLEENPSLDDIANASFFSKYHFHRIFHSVVGETVAQFVRRIRLEKSANFLTYNNDIDITSIAHLFGFSSSQNFAKAFRKHFNTSPGKFRQQNRKKSKNGNDKYLPPLYIHNHLSQSSLINKRSYEMNVEVKEMPEFHVCYVRQIGPYGPGCGAANQRLMHWAGPRGFAASGINIGVAWDNPEITPPAKCRYDACLTVPVGTKSEGYVGVQTLSGGSYAVYRCHIKTDEFGKAWEELFSEWLPGSGYQPDDRQCYEIYRKGPENDPDNKWVIDICCPVRPL